MPEALALFDPAFIQLQGHLVWSLAHIQAACQALSPLVRPGFVIAALYVGEFVADILDLKRLPKWLKLGLAAAAAWGE